MENPVAEKQSSYRYWVRDSTVDAAPLPAPRKLSAEDVANKAQSAPLGSVWNQIPKSGRQRAYCK